MCQKQKIVFKILFHMHDDMVRSLNKILNKKSFYKCLHHMKYLYLNLLFMITKIEYYT